MAQTPVLAYAESGAAMSQNLLDQLAESHLQLARMQSQTVLRYSMRDADSS
jgi:hypothetical protein